MGGFIPAFSSDRRGFPHYFLRRPNRVVIVGGSIFASLLRTPALTALEGHCLQTLLEVLRSRKYSNSLQDYVKIATVPHSFRSFCDDARQDTIQYPHGKSVQSDSLKPLQIQGDLVSKETVCCVGGKVKH